MTYILPVLYVIVSYTFFLLAVHFGNAITLQIVSILLPFIMGIVNLIVVLTVGRKWSRKTLLNCTLIIKYGLIPFYLVGGSITVYVTLMAFFPLPLMALFGLVTIVFFDFLDTGIILGAAPLCYRLSDKVMQRRHTSEMVGGFSWNLPVLLFL